MAWEIANKVHKGRLPGAEALERDLPLHLADANMIVVPINLADALAAARLPGQHRDPWDRMFAAQALNRGIPVLSIDRQLDSFGVQRIW